MRIVFAYLAFAGFIIIALVAWAAVGWVSQHHPEQVAALGTFIFFAVYLVIAASCIALIMLLAWLGIHVFNHATVIHRGEVVVMRTFRGPLHASALHMAAKHGNKTMRLPETVVEAEETMQLEAPRIFSFAELLRQGVIEKAVSEGKLILGYVDSVLKYGSWLDLYSCAVAGTSGSGKTTTVLFLLFQAILCGAKIILIDPHLHDPRQSLAAQLAPLKKAFHGEPIDDSDTEAVLLYVNWVKTEFERRKRAGKKGTLLIVCIDEFNAVMRMPEVKRELAELLIAIEQEGRKFGIFALLIGQVWSANQIGGADLRRSLASRIVHRIDEEYAKLLLGSKYGQKCIELEVGSSWFRDTNGGTNKMITPATYKEDGYTIADILGWQEYEAITDEVDIPQSTSQSTSQSIPQSAGTRSEWDVLVGGKALDGENETDIIEREKIIEMLKERKTQSEIVTTVFKVPPSGRAFNAAVDKYRAILAELVEREA